jgi:hypothetical protein
MTTTLEALKAFMPKLKDMIRLADKIGFSRGPNNYAMNGGAIDQLVELEMQAEKLFADAIAALQANQEREPMFYVSGGQAIKIRDRPDGLGGVYLPVRKTAKGLFQMPLYATALESQWVSVKERLHSEIMGIIAKPAETTVAMYCRENDLAIAYKLGPPCRC